MQRRSKPTGGGSAIEWALLVAAISITSVVAGQNIASQISTDFTDHANALKHPASDTETTHVTIADDGCVVGTDGRDIVTATPDATCYKLGGGDDDFHGAASAAPLFIDAGAGQGALTQITTGAGHDQIISKQSGSLSSGSGNDVIKLSLDHPGRFNIDPGAGNDTVAINTQRPPAGAPANVIFSGRDRLKADLSCDGSIVLFKVQPLSSSELTGDCAVNAQSSGDAGSRSLSVRLPSFNGRLDFEGELTLDIVSGEASPATEPQGLFIPNWTAGRIDYIGSSTSQADFTLQSRSSTTSGFVRASLRAPYGTMAIEGAGHSSWQLQAGYTEGGQVSLSFPDEAGFQRMQAPQITGQADNLRIAGCFDQVSLFSGAEVIWTTEPCRTGAAETLPVSHNTTDLTLALIRGGDQQAIPLGADDLSVKSITISR